MPGLLERSPNQPDQRVAGLCGSQIKKTKSDGSGPWLFGESPKQSN